MAQPVIVARDLVKVYGAARVVDGIDFRVEGGECFGFLGPNGAGKTTTMRMITCYTPRTAGHLTVFGHDVARHPREIKARIGVVPQEDNLDPDLTVLENLRVYARYFDLPSRAARDRAEELLAFVQLQEKRAVRVPELSGGMKRRLLVARALINQPDLIILDEPTTGLDPQARHLIWQKLRSLKRSGATMVLTTHYMEEAAQLCDRLVIMDRGRILTEGAPEGLVERFVGRDVVELRLGDGQLGEILGRVRQTGVTVEKSGDTLFLFCEHGDQVAREVMDLPTQRLLVRRAHLEDVFLRLTGRELRE